MTDARRWIEHEQQLLWDDLYNSIRFAANGYWSIGAANHAVRVVGAARLVGPTHPDSIQWPLVAGGVYETLLDIGEVRHDPLTPEYLRETERVMRDHGGSVEAYRVQYRQTIAAMTSPSEIRYIKESQEL